jgi:hypothetical protein
MCLLRSGFPSGRALPDRPAECFVVLQLRGGVPAVGDFARRELDRRFGGHPCLQFPVAFEFGFELGAEHLAQASPDLRRSMLTTFICGAAYGTVSDERVNRRNGYRHRDFDTPAGTVDVAIPKLRTGSYFPERLLERRRRAERAMISVVATSHLLGSPVPRSALTSA